MSKVRNFVFTIYNVNEEESEKLKQLYDSGYAKYLTFTHELGKNQDNPHIQGYIVLNNPVTYITVKNKINKILEKKVNPHVEEAIKNADENYEYITKELKENPNLKHIQLGDKPLVQGKKRDDVKFENYIEQIKEGSITIKEIRDSDMSHYLKHEKYYLEAVSYYSEKGIRPPTFIAWFTGNQGLGKSTTAKKIADKLKFDIYNMNVDNGFFNTYNGEECSIWEDYEFGKITFTKLCSLLKPSGEKINIKNGKVWFNPRIQIYTSININDVLKEEDISNNLILQRRREKLMNLKRKINYMCDFTYEYPETKPSNDLIDDISEKVSKAFISYYKQHLIDTGYQEYLDLLPELKDVEPMYLEPLIPINNKGKIYVIDNGLYKE